jgi:exodeoxyribonuclease VII large subunit
MPEDRGLARISTAFPAGVLSVSQLNRSVRDMIEHRFPLLWVRGEISNCVAARSGHVYFALKDAQAQVRCVMFRSRAQLLDWDPCDGIEVEIQALVTLYEAKGDFQLVVESMRRGGRGALFETFQRLKDKLEREGLFDPAAKRPLPYFPKSVGIITSLQAAALQDVLSTLARRNPSIPVVIYPSPVQGETAAPSLVRALKRAGARDECDVLILCRGGGSIEDLWPFNEESVARAIRACPVPVVTGVGHDTDFSIADFAADRRAPTPTAAAELVSPERTDLLAAAAALVRQLSRRLARELQIRTQTADQLARRLAHPAEKLRERAQLVSQLRTRLLLAAARATEERAWRVAALAQRAPALLPRMAEFERRVAGHAERMRSAIEASMQRRAAALGALCSSLVHLSPQRVLERGYSVVRDGAGRLVADAGALSVGDAIEVSFARGSAGARIEATRRNR